MSSATTPHQPHDERAKLLWQAEPVLREFLRYRGVLAPGEDCRLYPWNTEWIAARTRQPPAQIRLSRRLADKVWVCCTPQGEPLYFVHLEFQSWSDNSLWLGMYE